MSRTLVTQLLNALEYHQSQTRPIHNTELAVEAAREYLATEPSGELAQSAEPYGWMVSGTPTVMHGSMAQAIQEQEAKRIGGTCKAYPVYTSPQQTKQASMTDGEIYTAYISATNQTLRAQDERLALAFARAIETHHSIKNI